ncbi:MAG: porphobilinogen synthase [Pseudomonadota bacterium]
MIDLSVNGGWPARRMRRNRAHAASRRMIAETRLSVDDLIWPLFVHEGSGEQPIAAMPGVVRHDLTGIAAQARRAAALGVPAVALFPAIDPAKKTPGAEEAWNPDGLANRGGAAVREATDDVIVMLDVALDPYNADGHDGLVIDDVVDNDRTLDALCKQAIAHARAGAHYLGPSDMMDGRVAAIRAALDAEGFAQTGIIAYAAKYASAFYGPFREAVGSAGALKGASKATYQMDPANTDEALREVGLDLQEGADMVMVKPGLPYLDIVRRVKDAFGAPTLAYQVSGEYAMIAAAAQNGWLDGERAMLESLLAFKRAGADAVLSYFAPAVAEALSKQ